MEKLSKINAKRFVKFVESEIKKISYKPNILQIRQMILYRMTEILREIKPDAEIQLQDYTTLEDIKNRKVIIGPANQETKNILEEICRQEH